MDTGTDVDADKGHSKGRRTNKPQQHRGKPDTDGGGFCGSSLCVVGTVIIVMAAIYGLLFVYIVHRGHRHRQNPHHQRHLPRRRAHDLSSLLLEGLPPLHRKKVVAAVAHSEHEHEDGDDEETEGGAEVELSFALDGEEAVEMGEREKTPELVDFDPVQQVKELTYLRGRLPV